MQKHEYALIGGLNRSKVGRYIAMVAATVSAVIVFVLLTLVDLAERFGLSVNLPPTVLSLLGAGTVFAVLYWAFDRYAWRWPLLSRLLSVPDLQGEWHCEGQTLHPDGSPSYRWEGKIIITQSWDKLRIRMNTKQSGSNSISAALMADEIDGFRLLYNYKNDPKIGEVDLKAHRGFAELIFAKDTQSATGEYFNGYGRYTFGTMSLTRI